MLVTTNAIILSKLRFKESDLIVKSYTQELGVVSFILKGVLNSKKNKKVGYYQLLSQLQLVLDYKENRELQYVKEVKLDVVYASMHNHIYKSAISMFLSEVLSNVLQEEEPNEVVYNYLKAGFQWLDLNEFCPNFHLLFLVKLTKFLGFYPDVSSIELPFFSLVDGAFVISDYDKNIVSGNELHLLKQLLGTNFDALNEIKISAQERQSFLATLLTYYDLHLLKFRTPKSLQILNDVFN